MKLPSVEQPERYAGLYVVDFGETCSVGFTAEEVGMLLESEQFAEASVYRICRTSPDGTMELKGVTRERFMLETGMFFYRRDLASARRDYECLRELAADGLPCRAQLFVGGFREPQRLGYVTGLVFPAEHEDDVARWLLDHEVTAGEYADGGVGRLESLRERARIVESCRLQAASARRARPLTELVARAREPIQRTA